MKKVYLLIVSVMLFAIGSYAQIAVTVTNPTNTTPNLQPSYASLALALTDLNLVTAMSGPVTLTCTGGGTETTAPTGLFIGSATLNPVLSATNTVTINTSGGTATLNAGVGTATPTSAAPDGILSIRGADYITIDGLTLTDGNAANPATMEYGIGLFKTSATDGAQNNTIKNCTITLNRQNFASGTSPMVEGSVGILVINSTATAAVTAITPTNAIGSNSNNKFYANTIQNSNYGIVISGYAAATPFTLGDTGNDIGGSGASTGNNILNFGGGTASANPAAGIRTNNVWGVNISYNTINNNNGSGVNHVNTLRGIYAQAGTSANATINNNTVTVKSAATTSACTAIENSIGSTASSNTVTINNNTITGSTYTTTTTGTFTGILNASTAANSVMNGNTVTATVMGTSGSANSCTFQGIYQSGTATTTTINNNSVYSNTVNNQGGTIYCIRAGTTQLTATGNTIYGNSFPLNGGTLSASIYGIYDLSSPTLETLTNNNIYTQSIAGSSTSTSSGIYGLYFNTTSTSVKSWSGNNIYDFSFTNSSSGSATLYGIYTASGATINIFKNKIYGLSAAGASSIVSGIYVSSGTTVNLYNNLVGNLSATSANAANPLNGINIQGSTTSNVYYNTVNLNASSTGALFGSSALNASTSPALTLRNNIFINTSTTNGAAFTAAYRRSSTTLTTYGATSNNNLFYAGSAGPTNVIYYDGTANDLTLAAYKTRVTPRDAAAISENPTFLNTTGSTTGFLHIDPTIGTQVESGGAFIAGFLDDYDGDTRNATTPDIGADEGTFTPAANMSYVSSNTTQTVTSTVSTNTTNQQIIGIQVVVTGALNPLSVTSFGLSTNGTTNVADIANAKIFYTGSSASFATGTQFGSTVVAPSGAFTVSGTLTLAPGTNYFWLTYDVPCGATPTNLVDAECNSVTIGSAQTPSTQAPVGTRSIVAGPLSGTYTIGTAGNYATLTNAVTALNNAGLGGNTTFSIISNITEPGTVVINQWAECGGTGFTLTVKPAASTTPTITGNVASAVIKLNAADNVIIDGSNNGTNSKDLTIENTNATTSAAVVWIGSSLTDSAKNNTIKNCVLRGNAGTTTLGTVIISGSILGSAAEHSNINNQVTNNTISKAQNGIFAIGSATVPDLGWVISNNIIGSSITAEKGLRGIAVQNAQNFTVANNQITGLSTSSSSTVSGILIGSVISGGSVTGNKITDVKNTSTSGFGSNGIFLNSSSVSAATLVANNAISDVASYGYASGWGSADNGYGIFVNAGGGYQIYYNSVNLATNQTIAANTAAINIAVGTALDIRNNVFVNTQTTGTRYAIYSAVANTAYANINYNDYFSAGSVGYLGAAQATLANWKTATAQDANSIAVDPLFNSATNLQPSTGSPLLSAATYLASVTTDINAIVRSVTTPTIGAYEQAGDFAAPVITYTALSNTLCTTAPTLAVTINDATGVNVTPGTAPRLYYRKGGAAAEADVFGNYPTDNNNSFNGWKYVEATGTAPNFSFALDYSKLSSAVAAGDSITYFVIAQDIVGTPNVGKNTVVFNGGTYSPTSVNIASTGAVPTTGTQGYKIITTVPTTQPSTASTTGGATGVQVLRVDVPANNCGNITQLVMTTTGTSNVADITKAKLYYTTTATFASTTQFGSDINFPSGTMQFNGSIATSAVATNYFWLVYDIECAAPSVAGNVIDADLTSITIGGNSYAGNPSNPTGTRTIIAPLTGDNITTAPTAAFGIAAVNAFAITSRTVETGEPSPILNTQGGGSSGVSNYSWGTAAGSTFWYKIVVPTSGYGSSGNLAILADTTTGSTSADTQLALWEFPNMTSGCGVAPNFTGAKLLAANDDRIESAQILAPGDATTNSLNSLIRVKLVPGNTYYVQLDGYSTATPNGNIFIYDLSQAPYSLANNGLGNYFNPTSPSMRYASYEVNSADGWTYYYTNSGTVNTMADDSVLMSIKWSANPNFYYNGTYATGTEMVNHVKRSAQSISAPSAAGTFTSADSLIVWVGRNAATLASVDLRPTAPYVTTNNWWMLNKYWSVLPFKQPGAADSVRFYYSDADYNALVTNVTAGGGTIVSHSDMQFIKATKSPSTHYSNAELDPGAATNPHSALLAGTVTNIPWVNTDAVETGVDNINQAQFVVSSFSGGGGGSTGTNFSPIPVKIEYFRASKQGNNHLLDWKLQLVNATSATIILERSTDSRNFSELYSTNASAQRMLLPFSYTNVNPLNGMNYYRLKLVDNTGVVTYSNILALLNATKGFEVINIAPNPVTNDGKLKFNVTAAEQVQMQILIADMTGRIVMKQNVTLIKGYNSIDMNVSRLSSGLYQIMGQSSATKTKTLTFVKQ